MSTAVAGMPPAHSFRGSEKKAADSEEVEKRRSNGFFIEEEEEAEVVAEEEALSESSSIGAASSESSSIGENSSSGGGGKGGAEEEEGEEVESKVKVEGLGTLESLEDALPIKRGLSNFYAGKSKSFTSLGQAAATAVAKEIAKPENPFNKRRRVLAAWSRQRASCTSLVTTYLPPLLAPDHAVVEEEEEVSDNGEETAQHNHHSNSNGNSIIKEKNVQTFPPPRLNLQSPKGMVMRNATAAFRSPRSFSLSDLQNASYKQL